jgi:hypothetical protein
LLAVVSLALLLGSSGLFTACEPEHPPRIGVMPVGNVFAIYYNMCHTTDRVTGVAVIDTAGTLHVDQDDVPIWALSSSGSPARRFVVGEVPPDFVGTPWLEPRTLGPDSLLEVKVSSKPLPQGESLYFHPFELKEGLVLTSTVPGKRRYHSEAEFKRSGGWRGGASAARIEGRTLGSPVTMKPMPMSVLRETHSGGAKNPGERHDRLIGVTRYCGADRGRETRAARHAWGVRSH